MNSPLIADPLHRLDCCVISDGGGALIVTGPEIAQAPQASAGQGDRRRLGAEAPDGRQDRSHVFGRALVGTARLRRSGRDAGRYPIRLDLRQLHDHRADQLEDLGFCEKGEGGRFVADGNLISGVGRLPFNTDGGGLCNNHPSNRGGMTKMIEAVRQLRGAAHPKVQVQELRPRARPRHRRRARHAARQRDADPGAGVADGAGTHDPSRPCPSRDQPVSGTRRAQGGCC